MPGITTPGVWRYSDAKPEGVLFRPIPSSDVLEQMAREGWVDTPAKLNAKGEDVAADADVIEDADRPATTRDIREVAAAEAVTLIKAMESVETLKRIQSRERGNKKAQGGRKSVMAALAKQIAKFT